MTREELFKIPVPEKTKYYTPVPHSLLFNTVEEQLKANGLEVQDSWFRADRKGQQLVGKVNVKALNEGDEFGYSIGFRNSYDKSMSVAFVAGANVFVCSNGMLSGELSFMNKHIKQVDADLTENIKRSMDQLEERHKVLTHDVEVMKNIKIDHLKTAELVGRMFLEEDIVNGKQLQIIKRELTESENFAMVEPDDMTLWNFYNNITESLKESHALEYYPRHFKLHEFVKEEFSF